MLVRRYRLNRISGTCKILLNTAAGTNHKYKLDECQVPHTNDMNEARYLHKNLGHQVGIRDNWYRIQDTCQYYLQDTGTDRKKYDLRTDKIQGTRYTSKVTSPLIR